MHDGVVVNPLFSLFANIISQLCILYLCSRFLSAVKDISYQGVAHIMQRSHPHRGHHFLLPNQAIGIWVTWSLAKRRQEEGEEEAW